MNALFHKDFHRAAMNLPEKRMELAIELREQDYEDFNSVLNK